ncbi:MAG: response regulator transcription factor [Chloroflexi bacterium]|nr:response regulator transcription factor [Chloroflexota bacterium]
MKLLVVEDDGAIVSVIRRTLQEEGFVVESAADGQIGLRMASEENYDVIILDLMLPHVDGWQVCDRLRARKITTPLLMLTARDALADRVRGLESGADDYLCKPFELEELIARVRALIRRDKTHRGRVIRIERLEIDTGAKRVRCDGRELYLAPQEYSLLEALARQEGRILTRDYIQNRVWASQDSFSNSVDVHIALLRKKIDAGHQARLIHTFHRQGYMLKAPEGEIR